MKRLFVKEEIQMSKRRMKKIFNFICNRRGQTKISTGFHRTPDWQGCKAAVPVRCGENTHYYPHFEQQLASSREVVDSCSPGRSSGIPRNTPRRTREMLKRPQHADNVGPTLDIQPVSITSRVDTCIQRGGHCQPRLAENCTHT